VFIKHFTVRKVRKFGLKQHIKAKDTTSQKQKLKHCHDCLTVLTWPLSSRLILDESSKARQQATKQVDRTTPAATTSQLTTS